MNNLNTIGQERLLEGEHERPTPATPLDLTLDLGRVSLSRTLVLLHDYFRFGGIQATAELEAHLHETSAGVHAEDLLDQLEGLVDLRRREDRGESARTHPDGKPAGSAGAPDQTDEGRASQ